MKEGIVKDEKIFDKTPQGTIKWDFGSRECARLFCLNHNSRSNSIQEIDCAI